MSPFSAFTARRARHLLLGAAILSATVLVCSLVAPDAQAGTGACASDPVITVDNGDTIDLSTVVSTSQDQVSQVSYTVSMPQGTKVTNEVDPEVLSKVDKLNYQSNQRAGSHDYAVQVQVQTASPGVPVKADMTVVMVTGKKLKAGSVQGQSPQTLNLSATG